MPRRSACAIRVDLADGLVDIADGIEQILPLGVQEVETSLRFGELLFGLDVYRAERIDFAAEILIFRLRFNQPLLVEDEQAVVGRNFGQRYAELLAAGLIEILELGLLFHEFELEGGPPVGRGLYFVPDHLERIVGFGQRSTALRLFRREFIREAFADGDLLREDGSTGIEFHVVGEQARFLDSQPFHFPREVLFAVRHLADLVFDPLTGGGVGAAAFFEPGLLHSQGRSVPRRLSRPRAAAIRALPVLR